MAVVVYYVGPFHHGMARLRIADGEDCFQIWRIAANILNKQSWTVDKGHFSSLWVGRGANNSSLQKKVLLYNVTQEGSCE